MLGGRYETLKPIASGGMATVHLGRAVGVGGFERLVAIKVMHPHIAAESEFVDMFLDEARLAARIRHPNVVATLDVQADDGLFIVMEYVDGPSLQALRKSWRKKPLPLPMGMRILVDALAGLHAAHELCDDNGASLNLVHRDVSPANILIGADGIVRITDFGVALAESRLSSTRGGQLKGKIPYMPPDQLMGETVDRRCDVYAAGVVLWEVLTGKRLFKADSDGALLQQILAGPTQSPRQVNPEVPEALDVACMRALQALPGDRFATAADFADALEDAAAEGKFALASTRALARFIDESGAHHKLDARSIGELKLAPESRRSAPSRPSLSSQSGSHGGVTPPSLSGPIPSVRSGVTATAATVSAQHPAPQKTSRRALFIGASLAAVGILGGIVLARGGGDETVTPATAPSTIESAHDAVPSAAPATVATADVTATGDVTATATATATASATASAKASAKPPVAAIPPPPVRPPPPATTRPPATKHTGKTYNPDRL